MNATYIPEVIHTTIVHTDISDGEALEGGCGPVARALHRVFDGVYTVVPDLDGNPRHACLLVDQQLYDGTGLTSVETLYFQFSDPEDQDPPTTLRECPTIQTSNSLDNFIHDPSRTRDIVDQLTDTLSEI